MSTELLTASQFVDIWPRASFHRLNISLLRIRDHSSQPCSTIVLCSHLVTDVVNAPISPSMKIGGPIYSWFIQFNLQFYLIRTSYSFAIHSSNAAQSYTRGSQDSSSSPAPDHDEPLVKSKTSFCGDRFQPTIFTCKSALFLDCPLLLTQKAGDDPNIGGPGVLMRDLDYTNTYKPHFYFFYENGQDEHPWKYTLVRLQPPILKRSQRPDTFKLAATRWRGLHLRLPDF
jgi:hypothetical protein